MATYSNLENQILELINQYRSQQGLSPLKFNDQIQDACRQHSQAMATGQLTFGHDGFQSRAEQLLENLNGTNIGENVAKGQTSADQVVRSWLNSDGHRKNIEGNFNLTGIAVETSGNGENLFTQIFIQTPVAANPQPVAPAVSVTDAEQSLFAKVLSHRLQQGLPAFVWNDNIAQAARLHSQNMAQGKLPFGHDGFQQRAVPLAQALGKRNASENVALGSADLTAILNGWINSAGHRKNMEGNFQFSGIGAAQSADGRWFFTQIFIG